MSTTPSIPRSRPGRAGRVLTPSRVPGWSGRSLIQQRSLRAPWRSAGWSPGRRACHRAGRRSRPRAGSSRTSRASPPRWGRLRCRRGDSGPQPGRQDENIVAGPPDAAGDLTGVAAVVVVVVGHRPDHPLHGEAAVREIAVARELDRLEVVQQRPALPPGDPVGSSTTLSPWSAAIGIATSSFTPSAAVSSSSSRSISLNRARRSRRDPSC